MEKFSTWRDPSNGIAPFGLPVPTGDDTSGPLLLLARLVQVIFAVVRFLLFLVLVGLFLLLNNAIGFVTQPWPDMSYQASRVLAAGLLRPCLFLCFGYFVINEELASSSRRRSTAAYKPHPSAGDLIISNWSSYVDVLYLTYRYCPVFLVPASTPTGTSTRYKACGLLGALNACGRVPTGEDSVQLRTLDDIAQQIRRPLVIFAEGTTGNNRAILKFAASGAVTGLSDKTRVFLTVLKHDTPSKFRSTVTCPIPADVANPLPQLFFACTSPIVLPRHLLIRVIPPADAPPLSSTSFWRQAADSMCTVGKLKQTNLGVEEKATFLDYYQSKSRSRSKEPAIKTKKRM